MAILDSLSLSDAIMVIDCLLLSISCYDSVGYVYVGVSPPLDPACRQQNTLRIEKESQKTETQFSCFDY